MRAGSDGINMDMDLILEVMPRGYFIALAAIFGAMWGSFANVVIVRWPEELSVLRPASHCMSCGAPVKFYDNIPVLSYLILGGRCRRCKTGYSPQYAVVELSMGLLSVGVLQMTLLAEPTSFLHGLTSYFIWFAFVWALITAGMIDLNTFLLPDVITLPGCAVGIAVSAFVLGRGIIDPVVASVGSYAVVNLLFVRGYKALTGKQGMGEGDPKLIAMIGAFLMLEGVMFALFAGAMQGLIVGSIMVMVRRKTGAGPQPPVLDEEEAELDDTGNPIGEEDTPFRRAKVPFGPFLALGAIEYYFFGPELLHLYTGWVTRLVFGL